MFTDLELGVTDWHVRAAVGPAQEGGFVGVWMGTKHRRYPWLLFLMTPLKNGENWYLIGWDAEEDQWYGMNTQGGSDAIREGANELTEITVGWDDGLFFGRAGDTELFRWEPNESFSQSSRVLTQIGLGISGEKGQALLAGWIAASGTLSRRDASDSAADLGADRQLEEPRRVGPVPSFAGARPP